MQIADQRLPSGWRLTGPRLSPASASLYPHPNFHLGALLRGRRPETGKPQQGHAQDASICQEDLHRLTGKLDGPRQGCAGDVAAFYFSTALQLWCLMFVRIVATGLHPAMKGRATPSFAGQSPSRAEGWSVPAFSQPERALQPP